jgi:rod shape-determining protein MreB and related proteins
MFRKTLAIDFGTTKTVVVTPDNGVIYNEPSIVAVNTISNKVTAIGDDAEKTVGKTPENISIVYPIKEGVISSPRVATAVLAYLIARVSSRAKLFKPDVVLSIPVGITSVEKRAMYEAGISAGARDVYLVPSLLCAAYGTEMDIDSPFGNTLLSIGGGITEIGIMSLGGLVLSNATRIAGMSITENIITYVKKHYQLIIGYSMADNIKLQIGNAQRVEEQKEIEVRGRDAASSMPRNIILKTNDLVDAIHPTVSSITVMIRQIMEKTPPELSSDIVDAGIMVCGGTAQLPNIASVLTKNIGVTFYTADKPDLAVAKGLEKIIQTPDLLALYK